MTTPPDEFSRHEALHMASFLSEAVNGQLCEHLAVMANPLWLALAERASTALSDLYQAIGREHL
jgi:hypothetical protein